MEKEIFGHWRALNKCSSCNEVLSYNQKMMSYGVCPFCGANSNSTVVNTKTVSTAPRLKRVPKWWETLFFLDKKLIIEWVEK